ncbi:hypothetical protein BH11BAC4_BH11BAC4_26150 [soil metagenome]
MKRKILLPAILFTVMLGTSFVTNAQSRSELVTPFRKGSVTANLGVGFGTNYHNSQNAFGTKAALEFGAFKAGPGVISLGAEVGATFSNKNGNFNYNDYRSRSIIVAGRSAWHYGWKVSRLDTYAGVSAGAAFRHYDYNYGVHRNIDDVVPVFGGFIGASYFFTPGFGVNVEAGQDITNLQAGVVFKLR